MWLFLDRKVKLLSWTTDDARRVLLVVSSPIRKRPLKAIRNIHARKVNAGMPKSWLVKLRERISSCNTDRVTRRRISAEIPGGLKLSTTIILKNDLVGLGKPLKFVHVGDGWQIKSNYWKKLSLVINNLMAREGRTQLTRNLGYKRSKSHPNASLVRLYLCI